MVKKIPLGAVRFAMVGALGFLINLFILFIVHDELGFNLLLAQIVAAECAIISNFFLHHNWTFKTYQNGKTLHRIGKYHLSAWVGSAITTLVLFASVSVFHLHYVIGLVFGAGFALVWNMAASRFIIWQRKSPTYKEFNTV